MNGNVQNHQAHVLTKEDVLGMPSRPHAPSAPIVLFNSDEFDSLESPAKLSDTGVVDASDRYVAGEEFYNYELYGSLRKGRPVSWFSWDNIGLMAAAFSSAFSYVCLENLTRPMIATQLNLSQEENAAVLRLVELPMTLSFFVGLLCDSYPLMGLRRKGYWVVGCVLNGVSVLVIAALCAHFESEGRKETNAGLVLFTIVMIACASFGCIITFVCIHTRTIELSQREPLRTRGLIQADYLIFRRFNSMAASTFNYLTIGTGQTFNVRMSTTMIILVCITTLPMPIVLRYWQEEHYALSMTVKARARIFWKIMQQKAVWRIMAFISIFGFFLTIRFNEPAAVVRRWASASHDNVLLIKTIQDIMMLIMYFSWRTWFLNSRWRLFFGVAPFLYVVPQFLATLFVSLDITRNHYFYRILVAFSDMTGGITTLTNVVPLTEIIQEGSEGATVGLVMSLQRLLTVFVNTNAQGLFRGSNFYDPTLIPLDTTGIRWDIVLTLMLSYGINILSLLGLFFLPCQKLDAQQLRMYGGFTKAASSAIVAFCLMLFVYSLVINIMTFVPSLSCYPIAGGKGCM
ncbi:hypothetical protein PINS_up023619 [Pythium insidiosum]|nr:hypothetical protein PINS_up023619 [Pythium insidiosum]